MGSKWGISCRGGRCDSGTDGAGETQGRSGLAARDEECAGDEGCGRAGIRLAKDITEHRLARERTPTADRADASTFAQRADTALSRLWITHRLWKTP